MGIEKFEPLRFEPNRPAEDLERVGLFPKGIKIVNPDPINNPPHYTKGLIQPVEVIEDWKLGFHEANALKYIARAEHKGNQVQDLKKAVWYLNRKITKLEESEQHKERR